MVGIIRRWQSVVKYITWLIWITEIQSTNDSSSPIKGPVPPDNQSCRQEEINGRQVKKTDGVNELIGRPTNFFHLSIELLALTDIF